VTRPGISVAEAIAAATAIPTQIHSVIDMPERKASRTAARIPGSLSATARPWKTPDLMIATKPGGTVVGSSS